MVTFRNYHTDSTQSYYSVYRNGRMNLTWDVTYSHYNKLAFVYCGGRFHKEFNTLLDAQKYVREQID